MKCIYRLFLTISIVAMLTAVVPTTQAARPQAVPHASTRLTIATVNNPHMVDMQHLTPTFEKQYGIKVKYVTLPENTLRQKVTSDVATGGGQFDLATVGTYEVPIWAKNGWIVNLQPYLSKMGAAAAKAYDVDDLLTQVRKGLSYKGNLYALPFYGESSMTFYNKRLFRQAHLTMPLHPTWDQIASYAKALHKPSQNRYGICLRGLPGWGEMGAPLTTVINTFGGEWFDMKWRPQLTAPATKAAVTFYINLIRSYGEPGATSSGFTECETNMAQSKTAMWVDATVAAGLLSDPKTSKIAHDVGFAFAPTKVTPKGSHWLWAWSLAMESSSKNKDAAFKFLTWATSKAYIKLVANYKGWGNVPPGTRVSTFNNESYRKAAPYWKIVLDSMQTADPTNATLHKVPYVGVQFVGIPEFQAIGTQVTQNLASAITGGTTVDAALQLSQNQVTRIMSQSGYLK
jgi:sorbitol/mannitol transport system substrate-binding protein